MFIYFIASSEVLNASRSPKFQAIIDHATITSLYIRILKRNTVMGPKNSCAEMSKSFRSQKMIVLIVFSTLELV